MDNNRTYAQLGHNHDKATSSKDGFQSREDKIAIDDLKGSALKTVSHDTTLIGSGTVGSPLSVVTTDNPVNAKKYTTVQDAITSIGSANRELHFPSGTYSISTNLNMPYNITLSFEKGAMLDIATGITVTIQSDIISGLHKIFSGLGVVSFDRPATVYPEWFGAIGDGSTDDLSPIQKAINSLVNRGTVELQAKTYVISSHILISRGFVSLIGKGYLLTRIAVTGGVNHGIQVLGVLGTPISANKISGMYIYHTTTGTAGTGIELSYTAKCKLSDIQVADFLIGILMTNATNSLLSDVGSTCSSGTANHIGFSIRTNCVSSIWQDCWVDTAGNTGTSVGFDVRGAYVHDYNFIHPETASCKTGMYFYAGLDPYATDIHIYNPIIDQFTYQGILLEGFTLDSSFTIVDGWFNPKNTGAESNGIYLTDCRGISIIGCQFVADTNWGFAWGVKIVGNSSQVIVSKCIFVAQVRSIYMLNCIGCVIEGNVFKSRVGQPALFIIFGDALTYCMISNNMLDGYSTYGIYFTAGANKSTILGNIVVPTNITTPITNLGAGNVVANNIIV